MNKDRIRGLFLGIMVGDSFGMPVESWKASRIAKEYGRLITIESPEKHKWLHCTPAGAYTDDTQLTIAVAEGMIESASLAEDGLGMDSQAKHHIVALRESTNGWGTTTRKAIRRLANNVHWRESGKLQGENLGMGNGVAMKVAPVGAYLAKHTDREESVFNFISDLTLMTHQTSVAVSSALAMVEAYAYCLKNDAATFDTDLFIHQIVNKSEQGRIVLPNPMADDLTERLKLLHDRDNYNTERIINDFKGGVYSYESVPFTLMFFVKNPYTIESLYDGVNAGGDTDSNGSMIAGMLGALHGEKFFPAHLTEKLVPELKNKILNLADRFAATFGFGE